jgi:hypothetical protein
MVHQTLVAAGTMDGFGCAMADCQANTGDGSVTGMRNLWEVGSWTLPGTGPSNIAARIWVNVRGGSYLFGSDVEVTENGLEKVEVREAENDGTTVEKYVGATESGLEKVEVRGREGGSEGCNKYPSPD